MQGDCNNFNFKKPLKGYIFLWNTYLESTLNLHELLCHQDDVRRHSWPRNNFTYFWSLKSENTPDDKHSNDITAYHLDFTFKAKHFVLFGGGGWHLATNPSSEVTFEKKYWRLLHKSGGNHRRNMIHLIELWVSETRVLLCSCKDTITVRNWTVVLYKSTAANLISAWIWNISHFQLYILHNCSICAEAVHWPILIIFVPKDAQQAI